uniref:Uncharacterized protein n=1 Tax=Medicago truncatula TaxID=3880 RepID=B7FFL0_MEDTR|nr:unknown [Medicago truncatula]ACJ84962.1 unknown [Medicago truncatula]AFK33767.1 unknown [Medicago truncatula]
MLSQTHCNYKNNNLTINARGLQPIKLYARQKKIEKGGLKKQDRTLYSNIWGYSNQTTFIYL